ncbi:MAG: NHL repeat-containing protein, partial [Deltaproteobacteria bacterium]|nr:NHL repeat-containing protein [Deltaproteobacteria bacterium]
MKRSYSVSSLITVISLLLGVIWLSPALAADVPTFAPLGQITAEGLRVPGAMDLDEAGNLYVADARGGLVHKFNTYGGLVQSFDLQVSGRGLAVTPDGTRLYVSRKQSVVIVDVAEGAVIGALTGAEAAGPEFGVAGEIDLDAFGNVFVVDAGNMLVKIYSALGQYQSRFGGIGKDAGQFLQIGGMAINASGQVVVADSSALNGKVQVFTVNADLSVAPPVTYSKDIAANFGSPIMHAPRGMAFDNQGRGYFLEFMKSQVRVTSESFAYLATYNQFGYAVGQLNNVIDTIFDNVNSRLFVGCDTGRIEILGIDGGQSPVYVNHAPTVPVSQSPIGGSEVNTTSPALVVNN